jgi:hypothetical protein
VDAREIQKIQTYLRSLFGSDEIAVKARPKASGSRSGGDIKDSAEVFVSGESIALVYVDDEDGDRAFQLVMTILSEDLD